MTSTRGEPRSLVNIWKGPRGVSGRIVLHSLLVYGEANGRRHSPLIDGGSVFVPQSGTNAPTGGWIIEGEDVTPDIEVENGPI